MRILIAGFQHETNTFARQKADYAAFVDGGGFPAMRRGADVLGLAGVNIPAGGFIKAARDCNHTLIPVLWAGACPSAPVTEDAFERIAGEICDAARKGGFDAVYLDLHGAMVCEHVDDGEGELIERIRKIVGAVVPVVASLDLHGNISERSVLTSDGMVAYRTYPHVDMAETGARAHALLMARQAHGRKLYSVFRRLPFLTSINSQFTGNDPARGIYALLGELEARPGIASLTFATGFPAADIPDCAPAVWGHGTDPAAIQEAVSMLYERIVAAEADWKVAFLTPVEAVRRAGALADSTGRPVMIADTQDNPGAGGEANTTGMLRALVSEGAQNAAMGMMFDPEVAEIAHKSGLGARVRIALGGQSGAAGDAPFEGEFTVAHLSDGRVRYDGPMMHGLEADLGPMAGLDIAGVRVVVGSTKMQTVDRNIFRLGGVNPEEKRIVVVKSSVHFRADFEPISAGILVAKAPGLMMADPADLPWTNLSDGMRTSPLGTAFRRG